jgi:hypothetical protein
MNSNLSLSQAETVRSAMGQLRADKEIFEKFEIDSRFLERYIGKYQQIEGNTKVFDYWHDQFAQFKSQMDDLNKAIEQVKKSFQAQFESCSKAASELQQLNTDFPDYQISQIRANIDLFGQKITLMVLYKTAGDKFPEENPDYDAFLKAIYECQEKSNATLSPSIFVFKSLFLDGNESNDLIMRDFPISIRL